MITNVVRPGLCLVGVILLSGCGLFAPLFGPVSQTTTSNVDQNKDEGYIRFSNIGSHDEIFLDRKSVV